jgi:hypothetical protein
MNLARKKLQRMRPTCHDNKINEGAILGAPYHYPFYNSHIHTPA